MADLISLMKWPLIASLILPWLLVYLGLHIVQRGVIFVDLALAQTAAFGSCVSMVLGYDVHDWQSYAFSLGFTFVGAVVLTFTRSRDQRVPQEALIGIVYVVAAAKQKRGWQRRAATLTGWGAFGRPPIRCSKDLRTFSGRWRCSRPLSQKISRHFCRS
jgi:hypothetical protein